MAEQAQHIRGNDLRGIKKLTAADIDALRMESIRGLIHGEYTLEHQAIIKNGVALTVPQLLRNSKMTNNEVL